jgi:hypothetical protein
VLIDLVIKTRIFGDHFAAKKFGDQNTHFLVIISQLENLVIKTQLFGDQNTFFPSSLHVQFSLLIIC